MIGLLIGLAVAYPYPPAPPTTTTPADVPAGECVIDGISPAPALFVRCGISSDVDRIFELPLTEDNELLLRWIVDELLDADEGKFEVH